MSVDSLPLDLGDGLILRRATAADGDALIAFTSVIFPEYARATAASVADLLGTREPHPTASVDTFMLVEESASGTIVSSLCVIPQTWNYDGVQVPTTLIENVGTLPEYRGRGLVRKQFEIVNGWCAERGILVQAIAGIPWYYRQFGFEYAMRTGMVYTATRSRLPKLEGEEPLRVRRAVPEDAAFIAELDATNRHRWAVTNVRDEAYWRYEIAGRNPDSDAYVHVQMLERHDGTPVGYFAYADLAGDPSWIVSFELTGSVSWLEAVPVVLRHLKEVADRRDEEPEEVFTLLELGVDHPSYAALPDVLTACEKAFSMYIRLNDIPAFLTKIAPVLERRLAESVAHGYSGELPINLYRTGLKLTFDAGRLVSVETERMEATVGASLPDLVALQLFFGYRSLAELDAWYPDCRIRTNEARVLLDALFPKKPTFVWPLW